MPVTIATDFGRYYPAAMRGVLAARGIDAIYDVTHALPRHDHRQGAFWLRELLPYFPPAVHCVVVDPGVGTDRDVLAIAAGGHVLVGPDTGILWPVARRLAGQKSPEAYSFDHAEPASQTFHGRDVFAPLAAAIAHLGSARFRRLPTLTPASDPKRYEIPTASVTESGATVTVLSIDHFGNSITSLPGKQVADRFGTTARLAGTSIPIAKRYGSVKSGEALLTVGSHGYGEIAVNRGSAAESFGLAVGDRVRITW